MLPHVVSMTLLDITNLRLRGRGGGGGVLVTPQVWTINFRHDPCRGMLDAF